MKIILSEHFCKRYRKRVGYLSDAAIKQKIRRGIRQFDHPLIVNVKFRLDENFCAVVGREGNDTWRAITITKE